tara:strand:+ start:338 stop:532 length:195 start_codon:yes stop_codon:yes gene_type:complete
MKKESIGFMQEMYDRGIELQRKEKTDVIDKLMFQLKRDVISGKLTGQMLRDLRKTIDEMIVSDF